MSAAPVSVRLDRQGRFVVPAVLRRELGLHDGSVLAISTDGHRLILEPRDEVLRRVRGRFSRVPADVRLPEELLDDRRNEAARGRATTSNS